MSIEFMDPCGEVLQSFADYTKVGTVTVDSGFAFGTSGNCYKFGASGTLQRTITSNSAGRLCFYFKLDTLPAPTNEFTLIRFGSSALEFRVRDTGVLLLAASGGVQVGSDGTTISTSTWYRATITWNSTTAKLFLNGVQDVSGSLSAPGSITSILMGNISGTLTYYIDSLFYEIVDNLTDLYARVTNKKPASTNTGNFDTTIGTGAVNESPISETNGVRHNAATNVQQNYTLEDAATGYVDMSVGVPIARQAWIWAKNGTLDAVTSFKNNSKSAGTTLAITVSGATVGNTYLIAFAMDGAAGTVSATDNASTPNTYVVDVDKAAASPGTGNVRCCIIRAYIATVTSLTTVTITMPSVTAKAAVVCEFAGIQQSSPLDKSTSGVGSGTAASSGATAATTQDDEIIFGAIAIECDRTTSPAGGTAGTGMTPDQTRINFDGSTGGGDASNCTAHAQYALQVAVGTQTANATVVSTDWAACIACYKATSPLGPKIMDNGTETSVVLATTSAIYRITTVGTSYPSNAAGIGIRSSISTADTYLYECGMVIAYNPDAVPATNLPNAFILLGVGPS